MSILDILNEIGADNSRLIKEKILLREKNNELLQRVIKACLDPYITYGIKKIPAYSHSTSTTSLSDAINGLQYLADRTYTGNDGIDHLRGILETCHPDDAKVIERIIGRSLECAVGEPSCNKIWPGIIPTFDVMLAHKDTSGIKYPAYAQVKSDGMRCHLHFDGNTVTAWTRAGKIIDVKGKLDSSAKCLMSAGETWDGELLMWDSKKNKPLDRKTGNGILNKGIRGTISEAEATDVRFVCWDIVDFSSTKPYSLRLSEMNSRFLTINNDADETLARALKDDPIRFVPIKSVKINNEAEAIEFYLQCIADGEEGSLEKNINSVWQPKRTKDLGKRKAEEEADLVIVGMKPGKGKSDKFKDLMGSLDCETADGKLEVNVSGFDFDTRVDMTNNPQKYIKHVCTVKYNQLIKDKTSGKYSLFLPRWVELRTDKNVANKLDELK